MKADDAGQYRAGHDWLNHMDGQCPECRAECKAWIRSMGRSGDAGASSASRDEVGQ